MQEADLKRVWDAWDANCRILEFTRGVDQDQFVKSDLLRSAVERQFEICGEALGYLRGNEEIERDIPDLHKVVGLRNRLIHCYDAIDPEILWTIIASNIPRLQGQLTTILKDAGVLKE